MNRLSMDLSEMTLTVPSGYDEETWLIQPTNGGGGGDIVKNGAVNGNGHGAEEEDEENLDAWLEGAVKKVDFRTRSALSRRLEKKRQKHESKETKKLASLESPLEMIAEVSGECSGSLRSSSNGSRRASSSQGEGVTMMAVAAVADKAPSKQSPRSEVEELFFDAISDGHSNDVFVTPRYDYRPVAATTTTTTAIRMRNTAPREEQHQHPMSLSEIERRAREQEQELRMELQSRKERVAPHEGTTSRPHSSSSNGSSLNALSISKWVDFHTGGVAGMPSTPRSSDGSTNDLNLTDGATMKTTASRLPLLRRHTAGKTNIPLPTPKYKRPQSRTGVGQQQPPPPPHNDDECF